MKKLILATLIMSFALLASCSKSGVDAPPTPVLDTDVESLAFAITGETKELKITSNVDWDVVEIGEGITVTPTKGKGNMTVSVTMAANETYAEIKTIFKVKGITIPIPKEITVTQIGILKGLIHIKEAGTLASLLEANPSLKTETSLKITGTMNEADFTALKSATKATLEVVDISELTITALPANAFAELVEGNYVGYPKLKTITLPAGLTTIGESAFSGCTSLTEITIPAGVTSIGTMTFQGCSKLESITIPNGVTKIEGSTFAGCEALKEIVIPSGMTSIGNYAFQDCTSLASITLPAGVTTIGSSAFQYCESLTSVTLLSGLTSIGSSAFQDCTSLESITLPDGLTSIGSSAFQYCESLTSVTLLSGLTSIGSSAFQDCTSLESITLPDGLTSIGSYAFAGCSALKDVTCLAIKPPVLGMEAFIGIHTDKTLKVPVGSFADYKASSWISYFPEGVISVIADINVATVGGLGALLEANPSLKTEPELRITGTMNDADFVALKTATRTTLTSLDISELNITALPDKAFGGEFDFASMVWINKYEKLHTISLPTGLKEIGEDAFKACSVLTSITIPDGVTFIGESAFSGCSSLESITLPVGVTEIEKYAFYDCSALTEIIIPKGVTEIGNYAFADCSSLASITIPDGVTSIGTGAFHSCTSLTEITIPKGVTSIGEEAFRSCTSLTEITIPKGVTTIGERAFHSCTSLTEITIPKGVTSIGEEAFYGCTLLNNVTLPAGLTSIGVEAFNGCKTLASITLPDGLTSIGVYAFYGCSALKDVTCLATVPPSLGANAFLDTPEAKTLKVPAASVAAYKGNTSWKSYFPGDGISGI